MNLIASRQMVLFAGVGVLNTLLHVAVAVTAIRVFSVPVWLANGIAFTVATSFSYVVNTRVTFGKRPARKSLTRYIVVAIGGLLLSMGISGLADRAGLSYFAGIACVIIVVTGLAFITHRKWTYS